MRGGGPLLSSSGDGEGGEFLDEPLEFLSLFEVVAQEIDLVGGDAGASVGPVFPTLVFVIGAIADGALSVGGRAFTVFFLEGAKFDGFEFGKAGEDFIAVGWGTGGIRHGSNMSSILDIFKSK